MHRQQLFGGRLAAEAGVQGGRDESGLGTRPRRQSPLKDPRHDQTDSRQNRNFNPQADKGWQDKGEKTVRLILLQDMINRHVNIVDIGQP